MKNATSNSISISRAMRGLDKAHPTTPSLKLKTGTTQAGAVKILGRRETPGRNPVCGVAETGISADSAFVSATAGKLRRRSARSARIVDGELAARNSGLIIWGAGVLSPFRTTGPAVETVDEIGHKSSGRASCRV